MIPLVRPRWRRIVAVSAALFVLAVPILAVITSHGCQTGPTTNYARSFAGPKAFADATDRLGAAAAVRGWGGLAAFDYDNDSDIDLLITSGPGAANVLLRNDGQAGFVDVAAEAGVAFVADNCSTCGVGDFNNDGWLDLLIGRQRLDLPPSTPVGSIMLLNNGANGQGDVTFRQVSPQESGLTSDTPAMGFGVGDLDNDRLLDIVIGRYDISVVALLLVPIYESQPNEVWRCTGVVSGVPQYQRVTGQNLAGGLQSGFSPDTANQMFNPGTFVIHLSDVDNDGRLDMFYLHDIPGGIDYLHNDGNMTFSFRQQDILNKHGGWMGIAGGDYDGDADIDYFITNVGCDFTTSIVPNTVGSAHLQPNGTFYHKLLRNDAGVLSDVTAATSVVPSGPLPPENAIGGGGLAGTEFGFGTVWMDTDNRGVLDLYWTGDLITFIQAGIIFNSHGVGRFLENSGNGSFVDKTAERALFNIQPDRPLAFGQQDAARAVVAMDVNGDLNEDLIVTNSTVYGPPNSKHRLFLNPGVPGQHSLTVRLQGTTSNRFGIGARITATANGRSQAREVLTTVSAFSAVQPQAHFGFGASTLVDQVHVRWPSGKTSTLNNVAVDQILTVVEP